MTWANVLATGSGAVALRLVIEGMADEWVTDSRLAGAGSHDRVRRVGFVGSSFSFSEKADIAKATLSGNGFTARIVDADTQATLDFAKLPTATTWLTANAERVDTSITVRSTAGFFANDYISVGTECMKITTVVSATVFNVSRAQRDTILQKHYTGDGANLRAPEVTNRPVSIEGRRVYVYAYGDAETGDGTKIYTGICATEARLTSTTSWEVTVDPIVKILDQDIGGDLSNAVTPRGILYQGGICDLTVNVSQSATNVPSTFSGGYFSFRLSEAFSGGGPNETIHFETQEEFCDAVNAAIVTASASLAQPLSATGAGGAPTLRAIPDADGGWHMEYKADSAAAKWLYVAYSSDIDATPTPGVYRLTQGGMDQTSVAVSQTYLIPADTVKVDGAGTVPRGCFPGRFTTHGSTADSSTFRGRVIYVSGGVSLSLSLATAKIEFPALGPFGAETVNMEVRSVDSTDRWVTFDWISGEVPPSQHWYTSAGLPSITFGRSAVRGNLWDFIEEITTAAPDDANNGAVPFVIAGTDINNTVSPATIDALTAGSPFLALRYYGQFKPIKFSEIISPELLLMGAIVSTDSEGKITFRKLRAVAGTDTSSATIDASSQLDFPAWERNAFGAVNTIELSTGWDPRDDSYNGRTFVVRDVGALSRNKTARKMSIKPKSYLASDGDSGVSENDVINMTSPIIGLLGYPYDVVTIKVPLTLFSTFIGDSVTLTSAQLPNASNGLRGVGPVSGLVIGRKWSVMDGDGELTILVTLQNLAGYTPTAKILASSLVAGTTYDLTLGGGGWYSDADAFAVNDEIKVFNIDSTSPTVRTGTLSVVNTTTNVVRVTLSGALPAGTVHLDYTDSGNVQASQQVYAFVAGSDSQINYIANDAPARTFAP